MSQLIKKDTVVVGVIKEIVPNVGPSVFPDALGVITIIGGDNITTDGTVPNTLEIRVSGTTDHAVQVGNATGSLASLAVGTDGQVLLGATGADPAFATLTSTDGSVTFTPGAATLDLSAAAANIDQDQIYYVGKHGNDLNSGLNIENAVLTFGQAIILATAAVPSAVNRFALTCLDDGIYAEDLTVPQYVDIFAPSATLTGSLVLTDDSTIKFSALNVADGVIGILKTAGTSYTNVEIDHITCALGGVGLVSTAGFVNFHWKEMYVADGFGIGDITSAIGHIHIFGGDIYITGTGIGIARDNLGSILGHVDHIADIGGGVGTGILVLNGSVDISVHTLDCDTAYNVDSATALLTLFANEIVGTRTVTTGGVVRLWVPQAVTDHAVQVGDANGSLTSLGIGNTAQVLKGNTGADPSWGAVDLTTDVTGFLPVGSGGTGVGTLTDHAVLVGSGVAAVTPLAVGATGTLLVGASGADPAFASSASGNFAFTNATPANPLFFSIENNDTDPGSYACVAVSAEPLGGDAFVLFEIDSATAYYSCGIDNSVAGDPWKLTNNVDPSSGDAIISTTSTGVITLFNDLDVTEGGTGVSSFTAYAVICGGTTAAGDLQSIASVGTAGQVLTSNGAGALPTFQAAGGGGGLTWSAATADTTIVVDNGYLTIHGTPATKLIYTLPAASAVGKVFRIAGYTAGGWRIAQGAGQQIIFGSQATTAGAGGYLEFTNQYDAVECVCVVADTSWLVVSSLGNITVA